MQMVAEQATKPQNIETLQNAGESSQRAASWPQTSFRIHLPLPNHLAPQSHLVPGPPSQSPASPPLTNSTFVEQ